MTATDGAAGPHNAGISEIEFLKLVWPTQGHYCIASRRKMRGDPETSYWSHKVFGTIPEAARYALRHGRQVDHTSPACHLGNLFSTIPRSFGSSRQRAIPTLRAGPTAPSRTWLGRAASFSTWMLARTSPMRTSKRLLRP